MISDKFRKIAEKFIEKYPNIARINYSKLARIAIKEDPRLSDKNYRVIRYAISAIMKEGKADMELIEENVRLAKQKQKAQDKNRIETKSFREYARIENALEEYTKALVTQLKEKGL